jgi:hypothetical protein
MGHLSIRGDASMSFTIRRPFGIGDRLLLGLVILGGLFFLTGNLSRAQAEAEEE